MNDNQRQGTFHQCFGASSTMRWAVVVVIAVQIMSQISYLSRIFSLQQEPQAACESKEFPLELSRQYGEPSKYLIKQAKKRAAEYKAMLLQHKELDQQLALQHPAFRTIAENFQPQESWRTTYQPDISIIGLPKAATSHLYNILVSHPDLARFHPSKKEYCFDFDRAVNARAPFKHLQSIFYNTTKNMHFETQQQQDKKKRKTVNACMDLHKAMLMRQYLANAALNNSDKDVDTTKLMLILRDPADWLWSAWNFWQRPKYHDAVNARDFGWTVAPDNYRSPELFHEILLAGNRFKPAVEFLSYYRDKLAGMGTRAAAEIQKSDPGRILIVKSEDMSPELVQSSGFLDTMSDFLGVAKGGFNQSTYSSFSNCGNKRGLGRLCKTTSSAYAVAGGRTMLEESRKLVYMHFAEECQLWKEQFGAVYEGCLAVREKYNLDN